MERKVERKGQERKVERNLVKHQQTSLRDKDTEFHPQYPPSILFQQFLKFKTTVTKTKYFAARQKTNAEDFLKSRFSQSASTTRWR